MIIYKHPELFVDGVSAGALTSAIANYPDKLIEIQAAIEMAWATKTDDSAARSALRNEVEAQVANQIKATMGENRALRDLMARLMPDFSGVVVELRAQGFYDWAAAAIAIDSDLIDEVAEMRTAAETNNVNGLIDAFRKIAATNPPTPALLNAWQGVLDKHKIPKAIMAFTR